ncbi:MAG TPA: LysM peptidoglycan-binding domain-containing protein [Anaerolineae bacterium]|nr:LysM peptidoglycan-binding domain-containing protein [Anaerolineae bacterium]HID84882.1 LysM peptidoglycan-binding domain-containing protein [Anaerolineales bacterium]HIQ09028.1 LysM peptidoglycan-binding domain-containing protein [Anaerolineaceae bacterium]
MSKIHRIFGALALLALSLLIACTTTVAVAPPPTPGAGAGGAVSPSEAGPSPTPLPTRTQFAPGTLVIYHAQTGDTLPAIAAHFNTTEAEIRAANPDLPRRITTFPPGYRLQVPIYYKPFWSTPFHILPDPLFVNGPAEDDFDLEAFVARHGGWLKNHEEYAAGATRSGADIIAYIARYYSISPRLLLALLEYQAGALSQPTLPEEKARYPLGYADPAHRGLFLQLSYAANLLNDGYYRWRMGLLNLYELRDGTEARPDPWLNAATAALQAYFAQMLPADAWREAISPQGFYRTYVALFGDPWQNPPPPHIPGGLEQPPLRLPFPDGHIWSFTGGPHTAWGTLQPFAALDFAPRSGVGGCFPSNDWAVAVADGLVVRSENATVVLDLDMDGNEHTGWTIFYFHLATQDRVPMGALLKAGDPVGHPSCEGGRSTGTHIHIARKYNGEWIPAFGPLAFNLEGWVARAIDDVAYHGLLQRGSRIVRACECGSPETQIQAGSGR